MSNLDIKVYYPNDLPTGKTILVFSPHPDDTSICAGGITALLSKKNKVFSVVMTTGHRAKIEGSSEEDRIRMREEESSKEGKILGTEVIFLRLKLYESGKIENADLEKIIELLEKYQPELLFLPNMEDPHPTHHLCNQIVHRAVQHYTKVHPITLALWHYESPWSLFNREDFNAVVPIPADIFEKKLSAIRAHASQNDRTSYDVIASSLAQIRAAIVPEQQLAGYGEKPVAVGPYVELFSIIYMGHKVKLVESFSGVRGIFRKGLTTEVAQNYGYAYGSWLKHVLDVNPKVLVGMDTRHSSFVLKNAIVEGLKKAHCHIFDIGVATTPMVQFEIRNRESEGGVMITASHNEPEWNGFKFFWGDGGALMPDQIQQVIENYHAEIQDPERPYVEHYIRFLLDWIGEKTITKIREAKLKIVVDPNGGAIIVVLKKLFDMLQIQTVELNMVEGKFAHPIEPTLNSLKHMGPVIKNSEADFGVTWDCDGDRLEIILPGGELLSGHYILALLVDQVLKKTKGNKTVVVNAATSGVVASVVKRYKAKLIETDVGETNVVTMMKKTKAVVGGEGGSGGGIIPPSRCRDGIMTLLKIMELLVEQKKTLPELLDLYPKYYTRQLNLKIDSSRMEKIQKEMTAYFTQAIPKTFGGTLGGFKLSWDDGTFLWLRMSKTEKDLARFLVDSSQSKQTEKIFQEGLRILQKNI